MCKKRKCISQILNYISCIGIIVSISMANIKFANAEIKIIRQSWNLVDSGKHMDWSGSSEYLSYFKKGVNTWNAYIPGVIREHTKNTKLDVSVSDINVMNGAAGVTYSDGRLHLNKMYLNSYDSKEKQNTCTHELGHALGLAHNQKGDIMYFTTTKQVALSANDKATYSYLYNCIY